MTQTATDLSQLQQVLLQLYRQAGANGATLPIILNRLRRTEPIVEAAAVAVGAAVIRLRDEGLIQRVHGHGTDILTEAGEAALAGAPEIQVMPVNYPRPASALSRIYPHPGPVAFNQATGRVAIGIDAGGEPVHWRLWDERGSRNGLIVGGHYSGATNVLRGLVQSVGESRFVRTWVLDERAGLATYPADRVEHQMDGAARLMRQARRVCEDRTRARQDRGLGPWLSPHNDMPLGLLIINDPRTMLMERGWDDLLYIQRVSRKIGVAVVLRTYAASLDQFDGRAQLRAGATNLLVMRGAGTSTTLLDEPRLRGVPPVPTAWPDDTATTGCGYNEQGTLVRSYLAGPA